MAHTVGVGPDKVLFSFALLSEGNRAPKGVTFHVIPIQCELAWPVRVLLGSEPNAKSFMVGENSSTPRSLPTADANQLLRHLKAGGELHVDYAMSNGIARRAILGQHKLSQSVAMFEACIGMLPNKAPAAHGWAVPRSAQRRR